MGVLKTSILGWIAVTCVSLFISTRLISVTLLVTGITTLLVYDRIKRNFWKKQGIETVDGSLPIFGHLLTVMDTKKMAYEPQYKMYEQFKHERYAGLYFLWSPTLIVLDAELAKLITIKDFDHFVDRRPFEIETEDDKYANEMLTITTGNHWKGVRSVLSPTFSSGKMKGMFPLVMEKADLLVKKIQEDTKKNESTIEMNSSLGKFTCDVIATCAFGLDINCIENDAEFEEKLAKASNQGLELILQTMLMMFSPKLAEFFGYTAMGRFKYFKEVVVNTIAQRRIVKKRGDFVDIILEAQATQTEPSTAKHDITEDTILASSVIFLLAGYDTVKNSLVIAAHMLAQHPDEQSKLRKELQDIVEEDGGLGYQNVMEAKYLEAFIMETQRLNPIAPALERQCTKDYMLPEKNIMIKKGLIVQIPVWSLQNDERYWSEPEKFNPDRFLPENKADIVPGSYMPFGAGPRNCIAQRFALMEVKVALARLVQEFELSLSPGREELGLKKGPIMRPEDTMPLILTPIVEE